MNLRKIELSGFKTFARRTEVPLPGGTTAIVGPNGSGKSNLADALRWVLGEQSMQHIRSKKTEDVIFAGSGSRAPMGMAEVVLTLDNTSGWIPLDFSEVSIGRRAFRSGDNEYFINGSRVRLKDIIELRSRAGFGQSSYSVIGQGLVDAVLSQRPEERRALFEEAAGIRHYQARRDQTLDQLAATERNLLRVNDIVAEITPRLTSLRQQSEKARQFTQLSHELRTLQLRWYSGRFRQLNVQLTEADGRLAEAQQALGGSRDALAELESRSQRLESERQQADRHVAEATQRAGDVARQRQQIQSQIDLTSDKCSFLEQQRGELDRELNDLEQSQADFQRQRSELQREIEALHQQQRELEQQLSEAELNAEQGRDLLKELQQRLREAHEESIHSAALLKQRQDESAALRRRRDEIKEQLRQHEEDTRRKSGLADALKEKIEALQSEALVIRGHEEHASGELEEARIRLSAIDQESAQARERLDQGNRQRHETATRLELLQELQVNLEGLAEGAREIVRSRAPGILGPLAEHIRVKPGYERALSAALAHKIHAVLVEDDATAISAFALGPESSATLMPGPWANAEAQPDLPAPFIRATDVLEHAHAAAVQMLADVIIAPDLQTALTHRPEGFRIATKAGEIVDPDRSITRHASPSSEALLKRAQTLEELGRQMTKLDEELSAAQQQVERVQARLEQQRSLLEQSEARARDLAQDRQQRLSEAGELSQQRDAALAQVEWLVALQAQLGADLETLNARETALTAEIDQLNEQAPALRQTAQNLEQQLAEEQQKSQLETERPGQLRADVSVTLQRIQHLTSSLSAIEQNLVANAKQLTARQQRSRDREATLAQLSAERETFQKQLAQAENDLKESDAALPLEREKLGRLGQELQGVREAETALREEEVERDKTCYRLNFEAQRKRDELETLATSLMDDLQLTLDLLPPHDPEVNEPSKREVDALRTRLAALGPVNPEALNEYEEVLQRHTFLTTQTADLEKASEQLKAVISELEELTERQFRETFEAVEQQFQRIFKTMFGGGEVQLFLTQPEQVNTSGIEIMAQPPGKRLQSLAALSGGERALVGVSLVFAILAVKPVPFCLLDEVDAALDEANVDRFCQAVASLAQTTQFVLITHNRQTMAMADSLYGVSMGTDGVSRLVSMRLAKEESPAAEPVAELPLSRSL